MLLLLLLFFCYPPGALKRQFSQGQPQWCYDERKPKLDGVNQCQLPTKKIEEGFSLHVPDSEISIHRLSLRIEKSFFQHLKNPKNIAIFCDLELSITSNEFLPS